MIKSINNMTLIKTSENIIFLNLNPLYPVIIIFQIETKQLTIRSELKMCWLRHLCGKPKMHNIYIYIIEQVIKVHHA